MKKYNLSNIMNRAWELVKKAGMTISAGLKKAWKEAKKAMEKIKFEGKAKVAKIVNGKQALGVGTEYDCECNYFTFNLWERGNKKRIYMNDYKRRSVGYIDVANGNEIVTDNRYVEETAEWFLQNYEF